MIGSRLDHLIILIIVLYFCYNLFVFQLAPGTVSIDPGAGSNETFSMSLLNASSYFIGIYEARIILSLLHPGSLAVIEAHWQSDRS